MKMLKEIKKMIDNRYLPQWIVLMADFTIMTSSFFFTYLLRYNLFSHFVNIPMMFFQLVAGLPFFLLAAYLFKPHHGIIRHSTTHDSMALIKAHLILTGGFFLISLVGREYNMKLLEIPHSVIIIHYFLSVFMMVFMRYFVQYIYNNLIQSPNDFVNILIYGAGKRGIITQGVIKKDEKIKYKVVGFLDDDPALHNMRIGGVKVLNPEKTFEKHIECLKIREVIMAISPSKISIERKREVVDLCLANYLKVREIPDPSSWLDGKYDAKKIRSVRIEDLLGRDPISLQNKALTLGLSGKRVMVTGGAGSIGSEIVRQLVFLKPGSIIIIDQAESALFDIQHEIMPLLNETELIVYVADVTNSHKMRKIFERCNPQIIYHAAAYKHVPMMELQPYEAISNNVGGTKNLGDLAVEYQVEKFVMVSTDKAVNPSNIMGASKRMCEIYIQSLARQKGIKTQFITTRFGNVLGSNGSVIPLFTNQIKNGGPVTVTHKDVIRYFMTIPEACQLVMEAGLMGNGGEIFIFDMGKPIRIYDLAEKMISLSGFIPHKEIMIKDVGLRPGEKLYEEMLAIDEETLPTSHQKIKISKIRPYQYKKSMEMINNLLFDIKDLSEWQMVTQMKKIIPEFVSNNSKFEVLDLPLEDKNIS